MTPHALLAMFESFPLRPAHGLAVLLGAVGIYLLLPNPRRLPRWLGLVALLASLGLGAAAVGGGFAVEKFLFLAFSGLSILFGALMITQQNPARAALSFVILVLSTTGLFLLQAAPFLMAGTIIIYAGAIVVTFLFVIMLAQPRGYSDADARSREPFLAALSGCLLLATLLLVLQQTYESRPIDQLLREVRDLRALANVDEVKKSLKALDLDKEMAAFRVRLTGRPAVIDALQDAVDTVTEVRQGSDVAAMHKSLDQLTQALIASRDQIGRLQPPPQLVLSPFSGPPANQPYQPIAAANVAGLGRSLFSDYLLAVELAGTLLLAASIGAIAIVQRVGERRAA